MILPIIKVPINMMVMKLVNVWLLNVIGNMESLDTTVITKKFGNAEHTEITVEIAAER